MNEALQDDVIKRFNRKLEDAIISCGFKNVIEILEHAPGIISVMDIELNMLVIYSARSYSYNRNPEAQYRANKFCKKLEIGTMPFYIRGELDLRDFLKREFPLVNKSSWHDSPKRISFEEESQLNAA